MVASLEAYSHDTFVMHRETPGSFNCVHLNTKKQKAKKEEEGKTKDEREREGDPCHYRHLSPFDNVQ